MKNTVVPRRRVAPKSAEGRLIGAFVDGIQKNSGTMLVTHHSQLTGGGTRAGSIPHLQAEKIIVRGDEECFVVC